jgi:hypothetical protein
LPDCGLDGRNNLVTTHDRYTAQDLQRVGKMP